MEILKSYHFENYDFYFDVKTYYLDEVIGQPVEMQHGYGNTTEDLEFLTERYRCRGSGSIQSF